MSAQGKGSIETDDSQIIHFLESMRPQQQRVFMQKLKEIGGQVHDEVVADTVASIQARSERIKHLQVLPESKNKLRLANSKRVAFKKELSERMPGILRTAAIHALQVQEPEADEEAAAASQRVHEFMTKPNTGVETNLTVNRVELFATHRQGSTVMPGLYTPLAHYWPAA